MRCIVVQEVKSIRVQSFESRFIKAHSYLVDLSYSSFSSFMDNSGAIIQSLMD